MGKNIGKIIELSEKWAISKDSECWTVYKMGKKKGEPFWKATWYYPSLKSLIDGLLDRGFEVRNELVESMDYWAEKMVNRIK